MNPYRIKYIPYRYYSIPAFQGYNYIVSYSCRQCATNGECTLSNQSKYWTLNKLNNLIRLQRTNHTGNAQRIPVNDGPEPHKAALGGYQQNSRKIREALIA